MHAHVGQSFGRAAALNLASVLQMHTLLIAEEYILAQADIGKRAQPSTCAC